MDDFEASIAVLVAIDDYQHPVSSLQSPTADARAIADVLREKHGYRVECLYNRDATLTGLRTFLDGLQYKVDFNDRVLFYFAGHGVAWPHKDGPLYYLLPQDANKDDVTTFLPMNELDGQLSKLVCRHMLVVLDCCFSGALRLNMSRRLIVSPRELNQKRLRWFIEGKARQAIASSSHNQEAIDVAVGQSIGKRDDGNVHSPFARAFLDGLHGAADAPSDGIITATELYLHVEKALFEEAVQSGRLQKPVLWPLGNHDAGEFVFRTPGKSVELPEAPVLNEKSNPWKGLKPYDKDDRNLFFGRRAVSERLVAKVIENRLTLVSGASGIGKSSLVRAGTIWRLEEHGLKPAIMRPGTDPFAVLSAELKTRFSSQSAVPTADDLKKDPTKLLTWITNDLKQPLLIFIDQAEELITSSEYKPFISFLSSLLASMEQTAEPTDVMAFNEAGARAALEAQGYDKLTRLVQTSSGNWHVTAVKDETAADFELRIPRYPLRLVLTVRSEFEAELGRGLSLERDRRSIFRVPRMTQDELRRVIEGPAVVKSIRFESEGLVERLVNDVVEMPGALPILSFALSEMYRRYIASDAHDRTLRGSHYGSGGTAIADLLQERADEIVGVHGERTARRVLERFVTKERGAWKRRQVPDGEFEFCDESDRQGAERFLDELTNSFLVVSDQSGDTPYHELAHDTLIQGWTTLLRWVEDDADRIADLHVLTESAAVWGGDPAFRPSVGSGRLDRLIGSVTNVVAAGRKISIAGLWVDKGVRSAWIKLRKAARDGWRSADSGELWSSANQLKSIKDLLGNAYPGLNAQETAFALASKARARNNRSIVFAVIALLVASGVFGIHNVWEFTTEQNRTIVNDVAREWLAPPRSNPGSAAAYIVEQLETDRSVGSEKLRWSLLQAMHTLGESRIIQHPKGSGLWRLVSDPDDTRFMVASSSLLAIWEHQPGGQRLFRLPGPFISADVSWPAKKLIWSTKKSVTVQGFDGESGSWTFEFDDDKPIVKFNSSGTSFLVFGKTSGRAIAAPTGALGAGAEFEPLRHNGEKLTDIAWTPDGASIVAVDEYGSLITWRMAGAVAEGAATARKISDRPPRAFPWEIAVDGELAATWVDYWALDKEERGPVENVPAAIWKLGEPNAPANRPVDAVQVSGAVFSPSTADVKTLAIRSNNRMLLLDIGTLNAKSSVKAHNSYIRDIRLSADGKKIVTVSDDRAITIWESTTGERLQDLIGHVSPVRQAFFTPDRNSVVSVSEDSTVRVWSLAGAWNKQKSVGQGKDTRINSIAFDAPGLRVAAALDTGKIRVLTVGSVEEPMELALGEPSANGALGIAFSRDGRWLVAGAGALEVADAKAFLRVFDAQSGAAVSRIETAGRARTLAFSPDGRKLLAALGNGTAEVYAFKNGQLQPLSVLRHGCEPVTSAAWNWDGTRIATTSTDKTVRVWSASKIPGVDWRPAEPLRLSAIVYSVAWARHSNTFAVADGNAKVFIYTADGKIKRDFQFLDDRYVLEMSFINGDRQIAARLNDGTFIVHDIELGREVYSVRSDAVMTAFAVSPGGTRLATGYQDGTVRLMSIPRTLDELADVARRTIPRCLKDFERKRYSAVTPGGDAYSFCANKWPNDKTTSFDVYPWTKAGGEKR